VLGGSHAPRAGEQGTPSTEGTDSVKRAIYYICPDFKIEVHINRAISTAKADAARSAFSARGESIGWAIVDSAIDENHPHFRRHDNLHIEPPPCPMDITALGESDAQANQDAMGPDTHVACIIAGETIASETQRVVAVSGQRD
jgi:serine protease AprX